MDSAKIRILIIGAGKMARVHCHVFNSLPQVDVIGIVSRSGVSAEILASEIGGTNFGTDWKTMADELYPDACVVAVDHLLVESITEEVIKYGLHVIAEKPVSLNVETLERMAVEAEKQGIIAMAAVNRRYYPSILQSICSVNLVGGIRSVTMVAPDPVIEYRAMDTYPKSVYDNWTKMNTIHAIDLLRLVGGECTNCYSISREFEEGISNNAVLLFDSGIIGNFVSGSGSGNMSQWSLTISGLGVEAQIKPLERGVLYFNNGAKTSLPNSGAEKFKPGMLSQAIAFINGIKSGKLSFPASDLLDHAKTMKLIEKILEADA